MTSFSRKPSDRPFTAASLFFWVLTRIGLPLLLLYIVLWWLAGLAVDAQLDKARNFVTIRRTGTVLGLNGDIGVRRVSMTSNTDNGMPEITIRADRAVIHTPGLWWLVRTSIFGAREEIPSRMGYELDGITIDGDSKALEAAMVGGYVMFPFDLAGCNTEFSLNAMRQMGITDSGIDLVVDMTHPSEQQLDFTFALNRPGFAKIDGDIMLELGRGESFRSQVGGAKFKEFHLNYQDLGFAKIRNAFCQKETKLDAEEFSARHVEAASRTFAKKGIKPGAALTQAYAAFARDGGTFSITAKPSKPLPMAALQGVNLENIGLLLHTTVQHNNDAVGTLTFVQADTFSSNTTLVEPAAKVVGDVPATASATAAAPVVNAAATEVPPGGEIPYDKLSGYVGREIEVSTNFNSTRRGILLGASTLSVKIKVAEAEGGYSLSIPEYAIINIILVAPEVPAVSPGSASNAKKN